MSLNMCKSEAGARGLSAGRNRGIVEAYHLGLGLTFVLLRYVAESAPREERGGMIPVT